MSAILKLYNTLTRKIEEFEPLNPPKVTMYTCGPTVYDFAHIGNLRTYLFEDILRRVLEANKYEVKQVMNITDIEDKIIKKAKEKGVLPDQITIPFEQVFMKDINKLNIEMAAVYPRATEHVNGMIKYTEILIDKGFAYVEKDGSVYFSISKFPGYGKLSGLDTREIKNGVRVSADEYEKENAQDFALWKSVANEEFGYDSPWGKGRPGWHIECSVMSQKYLGDTLDIHTGAVDNIFPHHENEIAQSEAVTGKKFAIFFIHGEHLLVDGKRMAKSLGNYFTLRDVEERNFDPLALKYLNLTAHYRDKLNFTWKSLDGAQSALNNLRAEIRLWPASAKATARLSDNPKDIDPKFWQRFLEAANDDLGLPKALAIMWEMIKSDLPSSSKSATILQMDKILGLKLDEYLGKQIDIPEKIKKLVDERENVRKAGNFKKSDELRSEIKRLGFEIEDTASGPKVKL